MSGVVSSGVPHIEQHGIAYVEMSLRESVGVFSALKPSYNCVTLPLIPSFSNADEGMITVRQKMNKNY